MTKALYVRGILFTYMRTEQREEPVVRPGEGNIKCGGSCVSEGIVRSEIREVWGGTRLRRTQWRV